MLTNVFVFIFVCLFNLKLTTPQSISSTSGINLIQTIEELEDEIIKLPNNLTQFTYYNTKIRGVCPKSLKGAEGIKCETIESQCYCFIWNPRKSWWDARNFCRHHGMDLVSFETPEEENRVALKVFENFKDNLTAGHVPPGISFFSSGQRKFQNKDDSQYLYLWSSTGTIIPEARLTKDWHTGEPTFAWEGEAENCIQWHVILGSHPLDIKTTWNDHYYCCPDKNLISAIKNPLLQFGPCHTLL